MRKNKVFMVPIEPLEERYSTQWLKWFCTYSEENNKEWVFIHGTSLTEKIETGEFLDAHGTNYYKTTQLQTIIALLYDRKIEDGDVIFFHDLWFPGIEMLAYIRDTTKVNFKITGCLHAGTWDKHDFLSRSGCASWAKDLERSWFEIYDTVFVATDFHKELIMDYIKAPHLGCSINVLGFPIFPQKTNKSQKENIIVFPHRLALEKNPEMFDLLEKEVTNLNLGDWKFIKSKDVCKTKEEYYNLLERSKIAVSFADQETWGIAMQEAVFAGCIPFVPDRLSYHEMYNPLFVYDDIIDLVSRIQMISHGADYRKPLEEQTHIFKRNGACAIRRIDNCLGDLYGV